MATRTPQEHHTRAKPVFLNWEERDRGIVVTPENKDRFWMTVGAAIDACHFKQTLQEFGAQLGVLNARLTEWIRDHGEDVERAHLTVRNGGLFFLVVRRSVKYNAELADALAKLEIAIQNDPEIDQLKVRVLALPKVEESGIQTFLGELVFIYQHAGQE